jgi:hypothetical protein
MYGGGGSTFQSHGEKKDADQEAADHWIIITYSRNCQKPTVQKTCIMQTRQGSITERCRTAPCMTFKTDKIAGSKKAKDRVLTVLVCANMDRSDKQKLMVIGKSRDPRCLRGIKSLPVTYQSLSNAWMTCDIFRECEEEEEINISEGLDKEQFLNCVDSDYDLEYATDNLQRTTLFYFIFIRFLRRMSRKQEAQGPHRSPESYWLIFCT